MDSPVARSWVTSSVETRDVGRAVDDAQHRRRASPRRGPSSPGRRRRRAPGPPGCGRPPRRWSVSTTTASAGPAPSSSRSMNASHRPSAVAVRVPMRGVRVGLLHAVGGRHAQDRAARPCSRSPGVGGLANQTPGPGDDVATRPAARCRWWSRRAGGPRCRWPRPARRRRPGSEVLGQACAALRGRLVVVPQQAVDSGEAARARVQRRRGQRTSEAVTTRIVAGSRRGRRCASRRPRSRWPPRSARSRWCRRRSATPRSRSRWCRGAVSTVDDERRPRRARRRGWTAAG